MTGSVLRPVQFYPQNSTCISWQFYCHLATKWLHLDQFWILPWLGTTWIGCEFDHKMASPAICKQKILRPYGWMVPHPLVTILATRRSYLHWWQIWPQVANYVTKWHNLHWFKMTSWLHARVSFSQTRGSSEPVIHRLFILWLLWWYTVFPVNHLLWALLGALYLTPPGDPSPYSTTVLHPSEIIVLSFQNKDRMSLMPYNTLIKHSNTKCLKSCLRPLTRT